MKWEKFNLSDISIIIMGQSPPGDSYNENQNGLPFFQGKAEFGDLYPVAVKWCDKPKKVAEQNDILLSVRAPVGSTNIADQTCCIGRGLAAIRCQSEKSFYKYIYWFLKLFEVSLSTQGQGSTFKSINKQTVENIQIPLPPIEEQKRIADILDRADAIRQKRKRAIALTEELARSTFLDMFGDPTTNPKGWDLNFLGELAKISGGGTPSKKYPQYYEGNICWATSKDMNVDVLVDTKNHITEKAIENSSTKIVGTGALLVVVKSKILMKRLPVARTNVPTCFNQDIKAIELYDSLMTRYCHWHMKLGQDTLLNKARGLNKQVNRINYILPSRETIV